MANDVYFSVCPGTGGTSDIKSGSPTITLASGVATLSVAQPNAKVGMCITYNSSSSYVYIKTVTSETEFVVTTKLGTTPSNCSSLAVNSIAHPWASLSDAEAGVSPLLGGADLVTLNVRVWLYCYKGATDDTNAVNFNGYTTNSSCYFFFRTAEVVCKGRPNNNVYRLSCSTTACQLNDDYDRFTDMQICITGTTADQVGVILGEGASMYCTRSLIYEAGSGEGRTGLRMNAGSGNIHRVQNTVVFGFAGTNSKGIYINSGTAHIQHTTVEGCRYGMYLYTGATGTVINCAVFNSTTSDFYNSGGTWSGCYNNASDDSFGTTWTDISPGSTESTDWALAFNDYTNHDYRPKDDFSRLRWRGRGRVNDSAISGGDIIGVDYRDYRYPTIGAYEKAYGAASFDGIQLAISEAFTPASALYLCIDETWVTPTGIWVCVGETWHQINTGGTVNTKATNPNFEVWLEGTSSPPSNWALSTSGLSQETTTKRDGSYSVKLTKPAGNATSITQQLHETEGIANWRSQTVKFSVWIYCSRANTGGVTLSDGVGSTTVYHTGGGSWEEITGELTVKASATSVQITIGIIGGSAQTSDVIYIDGLKVWFDA